MTGDEGVSQHSGIINGQSRPNIPQLAKLVEAPRCMQPASHASQTSTQRRLPLQDTWRYGTLRCNVVAMEQNLRHSDISHLLTWTNPNKLRFIRIQPQSVRCQPRIEFFNAGRQSTSVCRTLLSLTVNVQLSVISVRVPLDGSTSLREMTSWPPS